MNRPAQQTQENQIRSGNPHVFDQLYAELGPRVLGYLLRLTGSRAEAEDLVQETFLAAYTGRATYRGRSLPLAWLLGIARRRWRDQRRHPEPEPAVLSEHALAGETERDSLEERVARSASLEAALARLAPPLRECLLLVVVQGLTYREAATVTGEPVGTVKWRVHEANRALRRLLISSDYSHYEESREIQNAPTTAKPSCSPCCW
jgi:RNA polymerase sigma-70 factor (ECF subfamily)